MQHYSERLLLHVKRAEQATQAAKEAAVREVGITAAQQAALAVLSDNPGINTAELAHRCGVTQQTMNGLLSRMELRGFVVDARTEALLKEIPPLVAAAIEGASVEERTDPGLIKERIRVDLQRFFRKRSGLRPFVLPVVMEI